MYLTIPPVGVIERKGNSQRRRTSIFREEMRMQASERRYPVTLAPAATPDSQAVGIPAFRFDFYGSERQRSGRSDGMEWMIIG